MNKIPLRLSQYLILILVLFLAACGDDDSAELNTEDHLLGTWTTSSIAIEASVGSQSLTDYLVDEVGMSQEEAEAQYDLFIDSLEPEVTGSLTLNSDNTYDSSFGGGTDSGTWSLSADGKTLTLFEGQDEIEITINSITATTWNATLGDGIFLDLDDDPETPDVEVTVVANLTLTK